MYLRWSAAVWHLRCPHEVLSSLRREGVPLGGPTVLGEMCAQCMRWGRPVSVVVDRDLALVDFLSLASRESSDTCLFE